jgi:hypothetical protein
MDSKTQARPPGSSFSLPHFTRTRRGSKAVIFAVFPQQSRPWLGAYCPFDNDSGSQEWVPMSWLTDGRFIGDSTAGDKPIMSGADIPNLDKLFKELHGT